MSTPTPAQRREGAHPAGRQGDPPPLPEPLSVAIPDVHTHLDLVGIDVAESVALARAAGVDRMMTVGVDVPSSEWGVRVAHEHPEVWAAVAVHPNDADRATEQALARLAELAQDPRVRAIGETGLDYYRDRVSPQRQRQSFAAHIEIATSTGKALVIHDRDAHDDVLAVLDEVGAPEHTIFHCFSGDADFARRCLDRGFVLSYAGTVTFSNAAGLREAAAITPPGQLLVESDAPFLTPTPYRGRPNGSYLVPLTLRAIAEVQGREVDELAAEVTATAARVLGW